MAFSTPPPGAGCIVAIVVLIGGLFTGNIMVAIIMAVIWYVLSEGMSERPKK